MSSRSPAGHAPCTEAVDPGPCETRSSLQEQSRSSSGACWVARYLNPVRRGLLRIVQYPACPLSRKFTSRQCRPVSCRTRLSYPIGLQFGLHSMGGPQDPHQDRPSTRRLAHDRATGSAAAACRTSTAMSPYGERLAGGPSCAARAASSNCGPGHSCATPSETSTVPATFVERLAEALRLLDEAALPARRSCSKHLAPSPRGHPRAAAVGDLQSCPKSRAVRVGRYRSVPLSRAYVVGFGRLGVAWWWWRVRGHSVEDPVEESRSSGRWLLAEFDRYTTVLVVEHCD